MKGSRLAPVQAAAVIALLCCGFILGFQLGEGIRALVRLGIAQKALLRAMLAEVRGYSERAAEAFERGMAAVSEAANAAGSEETAE